MFTINRYLNICLALAGCVAREDRSARDLASSDAWMREIGTSWCKGIGGGDGNDAVVVGRVCRPWGRATHQGCSLTGCVAREDGLHTKSSYWQAITTPRAGMQDAFLIRCIMNPVLSTKRHQMPSVMVSMWWWWRQWSGQRRQEEKRKS